MSDYRSGTTKHLVGRYTGDSAGFSAEPLPSPGVEVIIDNGDELKLTVEFTMPTTLPTLPAGVTLTRTPYVRLEYGGSKIILMGTKGTDEEDAQSGRKITDISAVNNLSAGNTCTYTWVLDSLDTSKQFKDLFPSGPFDPVLVFGDDFTVTAGLTLSADGYIERAYYAQDTDNSLFAEGTNYSGTPATGGTDANTALIANLRHLQNLCVSDGTGFTSKVGGEIKKGAAASRHRLWGVLELKLRICSHCER